MTMRTRSGVVIVPTMAGGPTSLWTNLGNLTASQASPAVGAQDYATMEALTDAKTIKFDIPELADNASFRFETKADADAHVVELWVTSGATMADGTTEEQYTLGAILTLTGGKKQATVSNFFIDTIAVTASEGVVRDGTVLDSAQDRWAEYRVNMRGYRRGIIIATTFHASTTLYAHARW